jgi:hypothetical protein
MSGIQPMDEDVDCVVISMRVVDVINGPTYIGGTRISYPHSSFVCLFPGSLQSFAEALRMNDKHRLMDVVLHRLSTNLNSCHPIAICWAIMQARSVLVQCVGHYVPNSWRYVGLIDDLRDLHCVGAKVRGCAGKREGHNCVYRRSWRLK